MKRIGITGPTGAGKTTALGVLTDLGAHIIDADAVYHRLLEESGPLRAALAERFGPSILTPEGRIDRKALGNVVFGDPEALDELNTITHRFIGEEIHRQLTQAERDGRPAAAVDAIALIESGLGEGCDAVVGIFFRAHCGYILENREDDTPEAFRARARALFEQILQI